MGIINSGFYKISNFLSQHTYYIPEYQRGYSWEQDQLDDFWQDLIQLTNDKDLSNHFLGQIVVHNDREQQKWFIIDGQQRTSTSVIFLDTLRTELSNLYDEFQIEDARDDAEEITISLIGRLTERKQAQRLILGDVDKKIFETVIQSKNPQKLENINKKHLKPSEKLIVEAREYFVEKIAEIINSVSNPTSKYERVSLLLENFKENFNVMYVETDDINEAFIIFETLNARGKDLETSDLLKNHIFRSSGTKIDQIKKDWERTIENLNNIDPTKFIRHYWNSQHHFAREKDLYKQIRKNIDTPKKVEDLLEELLKLSELYSAINAPENNVYYQDSKLNERIREIKNLGASSFIPIILSMELENKYSDTDKDMVLEKIESLIVRNFIVSGKVANKYEKEFARIAYNISQHQYSNIEEITNDIKKETLNDEEFQSNFKIFTTKKTNVIRYMLRKINKVSNHETMIINDNNKVHIEHILPKKPREGTWNHITEDEHEEFLWRLGNLTLLGQEYNRKATNRDFIEKKKIYTNSKITMTKELVNYTNWTAKEIAERQKEYAELALNIWKR